MNKIVDLLLRLLPGHRSDPASLEARSRKAIDRLTVGVEKLQAKTSQKIERVIVQADAKAEALSGRTQIEVDRISDDVDRRIRAAQSTAALLASQIEGLEGLSFMPTDSVAFLKRLRVQLSGAANEPHPSDLDEVVVAPAGDEASGD